MTITKTPRPKTVRRKRLKLSYGPRGLETLGFAFEVGGFTVHQHARFFGTTYASSYRVLSSLAGQKLLETAPVMTAGRPRDFYFLSKHNGSRAIAIAAYESGLGGKRAKEQYGLHGLPQAVEHAHARNQFLLALRDAALESPGVEVPCDGMHGESFRGFPLRGTKSSDKVYPDGLFEVRFEGPACCYYLEYESRSRPGEVLRKLDAYGAHFGRMLREDPEDMRDWLRPLVFLFPKNGTTITAAQTVSGAIRAGAPELVRYLKWRDAAARKGVHAGRLVLFASFEDLSENGVLSARYGVLQQYPEGAFGVARNLTQVSLAAVAREVSDSVERAGAGGR